MKSHRQYLMFYLMRQIPGLVIFIFFVLVPLFGIVLGTFYYSRLILMNRDREHLHNYKKNSSKFLRREYFIWIFVPVVFYLFFISIVFVWIYFVTLMLLIFRETLRDYHLAMRY